MCIRDRPAPELQRLDELLKTFAVAGFDVRTTATGSLHGMDRACDLAAFRIIQESLTNASKHGANGQAKLTLTSTESALSIGVSNLVPVGSVGSSAQVNAPAGHGLIGMRERAAACGGSLSARQDEHGVFCVRAVIPRHLTGAPGPAGTSAKDAAGSHLGRAERADSP